MDWGSSRVCQEDGAGKEEEVGEGFHGERWDGGEVEGADETGMRKVMVVL